MRHIVIHGSELGCAGRRTPGRTRTSPWSPKGTLLRSQKSLNTLSEAFGVGTPVSTSLSCGPNVSSKPAGQTGDDSWARRTSRVRVTTMPARKQDLPLRSSRQRHLLAPGPLQLPLRSTWHGVGLACRSKSTCALPGSMHPCSQLVARHQASCMHLNCPCASHAPHGTDSSLFAMQNHIPSL